MITLKQLKTIDQEITEFFRQFILPPRALSGYLRRVVCSFIHIHIVRHNSSA